MGVALAPVATDTCPDCDAPAIRFEWHERALFRGVGYGATRRTILKHCQRFCGWWTTESVSEINPRTAG